MFCALQPEGHRFKSTSSNCVVTLDKLLTHYCLWGRQRETTSLISSPGGVKANEPDFRQKTIIMTYDTLTTSTPTYLQPLVSPYILLNCLRSSPRLRVFSLSFKVAISMLPSHRMESNTNVYPLLKLPFFCQEIPQNSLTFLIDLQTHNCTSPNNRLTSVTFYALKMFVIIIIIIIIMIISIKKWKWVWRGFLCIFLFQGSNSSFPFSLFSSYPIPNEYVPNVSAKPSAKEGKPTVLLRHWTVPLTVPVLILRSLLSLLCSTCLYCVVSYLWIYKVPLTELAIQHDSQEGDKKVIKSTCLLLPERPLLIWGWNLTYFDLFTFCNVYLL